MTLGNVPDAATAADWQDFIQRLTKSAADLSLFFVGAPEDKVTAALLQVRANLAAELSHRTRLRRGR